jgi:hypothetical protein
MMIKPQARPGSLIFMVISALLFALPVAAQMLTYNGAGGTPEVAWAMGFGQEDAAPDEIDAIVVDGAGTVTISGIVRGQAGFGADSWDVRGGGDSFLASYGAGGQLLWVRPISGPGEENTFDMRADGSGNLVLSGWFEDTVDFGGQSLTSRGGMDMFVAKYSPSGALLWAKSFGGRNEDGGNEVDVLGNGDIAVSATSNGGFEVGGTVIEGGGERDSFVLRLDAQGNLLWAVPFAGPGTERIRGIAINDAGEVFVSFQYKGSISLGETRISARGGWDGAVAKLAANGQGAWLFGAGGRGTDNIRGLDIGPDGSVYAAGVFEGPAVLAGIEVPAIGRKGDDFLFRMGPSGGISWIVSVGGKGRSEGPEIRADRRGVVIGSTADGELTLRRDRDTLATLAAPGGRPTSYVAGFTSDGNLRFVYMPAPNSNGAGALGAIPATSANGAYVAQVIRFRGGLDVSGTQLSTPSERDSGVIVLRLNGG